MTNEFDKLEREVEAGLASLRERMSALPPDGVLERVRSTVRHELNERWLAKCIELSAPAETLEAARAAVRAELGHRAESRHFKARPFRYSPLAGLLSAAAMLTISFGVIYFGAALKPAASSAGSGSIDLFIEAGEKLFAEAPVTDALVADLAAIEEHITRGEWDADPIEQHLQNINQDIENLFDEPESLTITS